MLLNIVANDWFEVGQFLIICVRQGFMSSTNKTHNVSGQSFLGKGLKMVAMFVLLYILILLCKMISNRVLVCSCIYVFRLQCFLVTNYFRAFSVRENDRLKENVHQILHLLFDAARNKYLPNHIFVKHWNRILITVVVVTHNCINNPNPNCIMNYFH